MGYSPGRRLTQVARLANRYHAWRCGLLRHEVQLHDLPGPRSLGSERIGKDMLAGNLKFAGRLVMAPNTSIWTVNAPDDMYRLDMHRFVWLDHLLAVSSSSSSDRARDWVLEWVSRFGRGDGLAWSVDCAASRFIRLLHHWDVVTSGLTEDQLHPLRQTLWQHMCYLSKRWSISNGIERVESIVALILGSRVIEGKTSDGAQLMPVFEQTIDGLVDEHGAIESRNPEELLHLLNLLNWACEDLVAAGQDCPEVLTSRREAMARLLRSLRHSDGSLARFQGGGRGFMFSLDRALVSAGARGLEPDGGMGYVRMVSGRSSLIVDAAAPAIGASSTNAHASTLALEFVSGKRPVFVSCGSGVPFGPEWRQAGRATASHSVFGIDGLSSSRLAESKKILGRNRQEILTRPSEVTVELERHRDYLRLEASHDGYLQSHGVLQGRALELTVDGRSIAGEEVLISNDAHARSRFDTVLRSVGGLGIPYTIRFHLHPDVEVTGEQRIAVLKLRLKSGEIWEFRHDGAQTMTVESSVYLNQEQSKPAATKQIVLSGRASGYTTRVRWSMSKTPESLKGIRDIDETASSENELTL